MFDRLRNKMIIFNMAIISAVILGAFTVIYIVTYMDIQQENRQKLESLSSISAVFSRGREDDVSTGQRKVLIRPRIPVDYSFSFLIIAGRQGQIKNIVSHIDMPDEVYSEALTKVWNGKRKSGVITAAERKWQYVVSPIENKTFNRFNTDTRLFIRDGDSQIVFLDVSESSDTLMQLLITFLLVGIGTLIILFIVSFYFANRSIRPIEENWNKQRQFVADASHELKTPLSIINANIDALMSNGLATVNSQKKWIDYIQSESVRMTKLLNDMLYLAKAENIDDKLIPFELSNTVQNVIASMEAIIFEREVQLKQDIESGVIVNGDSERIKQVILIFLDNAVKYTNNGGSIGIVLKTSKNHAIFSVQNNGNDIPEEDLPRIFDRFYRCDPSRAQETGGYGLGLSIAKTVIDRMGGKIYAESMGGITTFTFELSLAS